MSNHDSATSPSPSPSSNPTPSSPAPEQQQQQQQPLPRPLLRPAPTPVERLARRIDDTVGKEYLASFCAGGLGLELLWQAQVERRLFGTPAPAVRRAVVRAVIMWPTLFVFAGLSFKWAARRVARMG